MMFMVWFVFTAGRRQRHGGNVLRHQPNVRLRVLWEESRTG